MQEKGKRGRQRKGKGVRKTFKQREGKRETKTGRQRKGKGERKTCKQREGK